MTSPKHSDPYWNDGRVLLLKAAWNVVPIAEICAFIGEFDGPAPTRNAVAGKAHRLNLPPSIFIAGKKPIAMRKAVRS